MITNPIRTAFEQMDDGRLLVTAAFFTNDYTPEALKVLKAVTESRGITEASIRDHRESCYPEIELEFKCKTCNHKLLLKRESFVSGEHTCHDCNSCNPVHYNELALPTSAIEDFSIMTLKGGGLLAEFLDVRKRDARRAAILDGTYWMELKNMRKPSAQGDYVPEAISVSRTSPHPEQTMNYSIALSYIFQDKDWLKKNLLGGLCLFIAIFSGILFFAAFFAIGYYINVLRHVMQGGEKPLPEWDNNWGKFFTDGLMGALILLVYFIAIGGLGAILIVNFALSDMADYEKVIGIIGASLGILLALTIMGNLGLMRFAATNDFAAAFRLSEISQLLKNDFGNFVTIVLFTSLLHAILFLAGLAIFSPFTNFWGYLVQAHLFGQFAQPKNATMPAVPSAA